jgi:small-conductance mechanosensitive channel
MTARRREDTGLFALVTDRLAVTGVLVAVAVVPILLPVPGLALSLLNYIVLTLGFLLALGALGLDLTKLTILAGAFGVGLGFGLPPHGANRAGPDPDARDFAQEIVDLDDVSHVDRPLEEQEETRDEVVHDALLKNPAPQALFIAFGDSAIDFELRAWTSQFERWVTIRSELAIAVYAALQGAGMTIPFPQREVPARALVGRWARPRRGEGRNGGRGRAAGGGGRARGNDP